MLPRCSYTLILLLVTVSYSFSYVEVAEGDSIHLPNIAQQPIDREPNNTETPSTSQRMSKAPIPPRDGAISGRRFAGGLLGTFVGFGTGHVALGTWKEAGHTFTGLESAYLAWSTLTIWYMSEDWDSRLPGWVNSARAAIGITGVFTAIPGFVGLRIADMISSWTHPLADRYDDGLRLSWPNTHASGISPKQYRRGGTLGTTIGFGIGHAVSGIYGVPAILYGAGELAGLGLVAMGMASGSWDGIAYIGLGVLLYGVTHTIEVVDIWTRPKVNWRSHRAKRSTIAVVPWRWTEILLARNEKNAIILVI